MLNVLWRRQEEKTERGAKLKFERSKLYTRFPHAGRISISRRDFSNS